MTEKEQISEIHDTIAGVLIGSIKSYDAAIKIQKLIANEVSLEIVSRLKENIDKNGIDETGFPSY